MYGYAPLWCKSNFSFLEGASHPDELVAEAHRLGLPAIAVTDRDGVHGIVRAHLEARRLGVKLICGSEITVEDGSTIVLLAESREGYRNLCRLITAGRRACSKGSSRVGWRQIALHSDGIIALWGGPQSRLAAEEEGDLDRVAALLREAFGDRLFAMVARHRRPDETREEPRLRSRADRFRLPRVAGVEVLYHAPDRRPLQDVLACIRHRIPLSGAGRLIRPNDRHHLPATPRFHALFADDPGAAERTLEIAARCDFSLDMIRYRYPAERLPDGTTSSAWLAELARRGAAERYGGRVPPEVAAQVERELALIDELDYPGYFLTMHEIVDFCREQGILCQGRGSAANSAVCWCLGITAVDPARTSLLFERFISRERAEPPDIDLDIEHARREEVLRHVYEKYGRERAAMVAVVIRYRPRSAVRDVGRVLGIPETALDRLARLLGRFDAVPPEKLELAGLDPAVPAHERLLELASGILDFPRHLSIHPGGFLLGHEPVHDLVPVENGAMEGRTVIQWDKDDVEALGLFKVDLLGLGALTHLRLCFDLLRWHRGVDLSLASIPAEDGPTSDMICRGDTLGVFQIESRAQMAMLPRLQPRTFHDLVVEISIVRPGPITGGMVHPYLRRRRGEEPVTFPHPCLEPVLARTLGVPLFQEQVMRLAMVAADYTPGEADQLRRDMAAWRRGGRIERHRERLVSRMVVKGIEPEFAGRVFEQIRGFGEYGFPESHAASFALVSWATAYLRRRFPAEFTCGLLNAQPMGFYTAASIVGDARRRGIEVRPICVLRSGWDCTLEPAARPTPEVPLAVRMGLRWVKGLSGPAFERIDAARRERPPADLADLARRTRLDAGSLARLAEAGALAALAGSRREALWAVRGLARGRNDDLALGSGGPAPRFADLGGFETLAWDFAASAHSTRGHPLEPFRARLSRLGLPDARHVAGLPDGRRVRCAGMVICRQRPATAAGVVFMTLEDETGFFNLVCWKDVFARHEVLARSALFLGVSGTIQARDGVVHVIAEDLWPLDLGRELPAGGSRDWH
jgi:error-prone DNA polymerase